MRIRVMCIVLALFTAACAISEAPPGGPEDRTAPRVILSSPENGTSGVSADADVMISFSEGMKKARFERFIELSPKAFIRKVKWKDDTAILVFDGGLHPDTTYIVKLKKGYTDSHGVRGENPYEFAFATSAEIDTGLVAGRVFFRREPSDKGVVKVFVLPKDSSFAAEASRPDRQAETGEDGEFVLKYLPARNTSLLLWAFHDADGNGLYDPEKEAGAALPDTIRLTDAQPQIDEQIIDIVDPREPGVVSGLVLNETAYDSIPFTLTLNEVADSLPPTYVVLSNLKGAYSFDKVLKGTYTLQAFIDFKRDSLCGEYPCKDDSTRMCTEPCAVYPDTLVIEPGVKIEEIEIRLEPVGKREE